MIKKEAGFGVDNFGKPRILNDKETLVQILLNILLLKPGNIPSMPHLGVDIGQYLYKTADEINGIQLKDLIYAQCKDLLYLVSSTDIKLFMSKYEGRNVLMLYLPLLVDSSNSAVIYSFTDNNNGGVKHEYQFTEPINF